MLDKVGYGDDGESEVINLRETLFEKAAFYLEDEKVIAILCKQFEDFRKDNTLAAADRMPLVFRAGSYFAEGGVEFIKDAIKKEKDPTLKRLLYSALGNCREEEIENVMTYALNEAPQQDIINIFGGLKQNPKIGEKFWQFVKKNHVKIYKMFGEISFNLPWTFEYATDGFAKEEQACDLKSWFADHYIDLAESAVKGCIDRIMNRSFVAKKQRESVCTAVHQ